MAQSTLPGMAYISGMTTATSRFARAFTRAMGGMSKVELADRSGIGRRTLTRWGVEDGVPNLEQLRRLVQALPDGAEDILRSLDLLPTDDEADEIPDRLTDPDERAIWTLGARREWPEESRWSLIYMWRAQREDDQGQTDEPGVQSRTG